MRACLLLVFVSITASAATFRWDAPPETEQVYGHTLYRLDGTNWVRLWRGPMPTTQLIIRLPKGTNVVGLTATSRFGESSKSVLTVVER